MSLEQVEKSGQAVDTNSIAQIWGDLQHRLDLSPIHNWTQYDHMVRLMNRLALTKEVAPCFVAHMG